MKHTPNKHSIYQYLDSCGVLKSGNEDIIARARKDYWRIYKKIWRQKKRKTEKEITVSWNTDELKTVSNAAKQHKMSRTAFVKASTLAYINKAYIIPDIMEVRRIAQLLALNYNAVLELTEEKGISLKEIKNILEKITELERTVLLSLHDPKTIDQLVIETIQKKPFTKSRLIQLLDSLS